MNYAHKALWVLLIFAICLAPFASCEDGSEDNDGYSNHINCSPILEYLYECGITVSFNDVDIVSIEEAWDSCQNAYGRMWRDMVHCYRQIDSCDEFAACLPEHGFNTDHVISDDDDDTTDDDTTNDDDDTAV